MAHWHLCIVFISVVCGASACIGAPNLEIQPSFRRPSVHAVGIQFDLNRAFVSDLASDGHRLFFTTQDGGETWTSLTVRDRQKSLGNAEDARVIYYNQGSAVLYYSGRFYSAESGSVFRDCSIESAMLRGQDGFRVESLLAKPTHRSLFRTIDGGERWFEIRTQEVSFDGVESFDPVATNLVFACVYREDSSGRSKHRLVRSSDSGRTWATVCDPETDIGIWATHVFFLNETTGWVSSDRDDGLFGTSNAGRTWTEVRVPERVISAIFFKNARQGWVIGGVNQNVYETTDAGKSWKRLSREETTSERFLDYFVPHPLSRWNDFALLRTILSGPGIKPHPSGHP